MKEHLLSTSRTTKGKVLLAAAVLIVAVVAGVVVTSVLGGGTADGNAAAPGSFGNVTQAGLTTAVEGLCGVRSDLQANDLAAARTAFYDKAHLFLHQLAAEVQVKNVDQATSLLVAKYQVEDFLPPTGQPAASPAGTSASPVDTVTALLDQVHKSAAVLGFTAPACSQ